MSHEKKAQVQKSLQGKKKLYTQELWKATKITREVLRELGHIEADSGLFSGLCLSGRIHTLRKLVEKADEALERINNGNYGFCLKCGGEIPQSRLDAVPTTEYCVNCKEEKEAKDTIVVNGSRQRISRINNITI